MAVYKISGERRNAVYSLTTIMEEAFDVDGTIVLPDGVTLVTVFEADFSGSHPSEDQFYTWAGRDYDNSVYDELSNIDIINGILHLKKSYSSSRSRWVEQMLSTGGLFESDDFRCTFRAKYENIPGAWQNVITYGTGIHWTTGTYSDGIKWPSGGEIDAFEQAGGYSATPTTFSPVFHYGAGTGSGYPHTHDTQSIGTGLDLHTDEWADFRFDVHAGVVTIYVNGIKVAESDGSNLTVNNNYLWNYKPFTKPQAFYLNSGDAANNSSLSTSNTYDFQISQFKIQQSENVYCTGLSIYPQMWSSGTSITFPVGEEFYLDRTYTPANTSNKACSWTSSDETIATVCQGYVQTLAVGSATITARCGAQTATYTVNVSATPSVPCAGVIIDTASMLMMPNSSVDIGSIIYKYPTYTTNSITVTSSNTSVARVSGTTVTAVAYGTATITAQCGNTTKSIPISVTNGVIIDTDFSLSTSGSPTVISSDAIVYDKLQTYSIQYTFGSITPPSGSSTTVNSLVGPARSSGASRAGSISYAYSSGRWSMQYSGSSVNFTPANGDKITMVADFPNRKLSVYRNSTVLVSNATLYTDYFDDTAQLIAGLVNGNMTFAPNHIKIALGDIH